MDIEGRKQEIINLISLKPGEKAAFIGIDRMPEHGLNHARSQRGRWGRGGHHNNFTGISLHQGLFNRLEALGIRPGIIITKISNHFLHGPVIIEVGRTQLAIGYGMASKILVDKGRVSNEEDIAAGQS